MTRLRSRRAMLPHGPNMTPMVDVVLVILIFFMAAMGLASRETYLRTGLPRPEAGSAPAAASAPAPSGVIPPSRAVLRVSREGRQTLVSGLGMERVGLPDVSRRLLEYQAAGASAGLIVVVAPMGDVPYQDVVLVHDACARAGIENVRLGVAGE